MAPSGKRCACYIAATERPAFIESCLPSPAKAPPTGPDWLHEIKHDGLRILARRDATGVRLYSRNGHDFGKRFPLIAAAIATLPARSCLIDGEAIGSDEAGLANALTTGGRFNARVRF